MHQMPLQEFDSSHEDFFEQMLSSLPPSSWPDLTAAIDGGQKSGDDDQLELENQLQHHQISGGGNSGAAAAMKSLLQQQLMMEAKGLVGGGLQFPASGAGFSPSPASHVGGSPFRSINSEVDDSVQALYNVFAGSLQGTAQASNQAQHLHLPQDGTMQAQSFGTPAASGSAGGGGGAAAAAAAQPRQRVRARRGQATDPHSIAERLRRERIAERMKALQELVPNANKTDKASMLDEIIDYVKFLQLQVKVLSMSRLGGAGAVAPLVADVASERTTAGGAPMASASTLTNINNNNNDNVAVTEHQVAKLMEEDMGSAMQYLQGKGLCLMPISLATAISTATGRNPITGSGHRSDGGGSSSPSLSGLTVQSATLANGNGDSI